jgi:hypothetical protein
MCDIIAFNLLFSQDMFLTLISVTADTYAAINHCLSTRRKKEKRRDEKVLENDEEQEHY